MVSGVFSIAFDALNVATPLRQFIGGEENLLVQTACQDSLSHSPRFSPLVFVGPSGTGKSFLAQGLIQQWLHERQSGGHVTELTGADFARMYAHAVETDSVDELRARWRNSRRFLVDDVQALAEKPGAQQELSLLIDSLADQDALFIATMATLPTEAEGLSSGLVSRLSGGLTVPVSPPGVAARKAILTHLADLYHIELCGETLGLLSEGEPTPFNTVPELQHALSQLMLLSERFEEPISPSLARRLLETEPAEAPSFRTICQLTAKHFQLKAADLRGSSRRQSIAHARSIAMYLCRRLTESSYEQIGKYFGKRDHTTVMHACRQAERRRQKDLSVESDCAVLLQKLTGASYAGKETTAS